ncbi:MAG: class I SAM-dependent methyltransferase [Treponema sp.]|nr:class I SAM-dependent methyltransferase [Treponema sp.]
MLSASIPDAYLVSRFINKSVPFQFRGRQYNFDLSQGLFSSAGVDSGTLLLLKVFSRILDEDAAAGKAPPCRVLDAGCGAGIIGICAAGALGEAPANARIRCQDRDELARLVTAHNAAKNGIHSPALEAYTEPLLAGPPGCGWDLILTNIPAKAGKPVLEDFTGRAAGLLNPGGRVIMVAVHTLADFFRREIAAAGAPLLLEVKGPAHCVFVYGGISAPGTPAGPVNAGPGFPERYPFYLRNEAVCAIEDIPVRIEAVHGASGFDSPGGAAEAAARLILRIGPRNLSFSDYFPLLVHEPDQGFFPCWLLSYLQMQNIAPPENSLVLSGRNILALEAALHNAVRNNKAAVRSVPAVDLCLGGEALLEASGGRQYGFIAAFPELLSQKGAGDLWDSLPPLLADGGIFLASFGSSGAERFDRLKPSGYTRLGGVKRKGFRALAYKRFDEKRELEPPHL